MIAILRFNLNDECDRDRYRECVKAPDMAIILQDISNQLRQWRKYDDREAIPIDEIDDKILGILKEHDFDLF